MNTGPTAVRFRLATLVVGAFVTTLNAVILSPLLTPLADDLRMPEAAVAQLATLGAGCAAATALAVAPWLDRAPRRTWLAAEAALLAVGSLVTALAPSLPWLAVGRALSGVGGSFIFGVCLAVVGDLHDDPDRRNRAIGLVASAATLGAALGLPLVVQTEARLGWRWAAAVCVPFALALLLGSRCLPGSVAGPGAPCAGGWLTGCRRVLAEPAVVWLQVANVAVSAVTVATIVYLGALARGGFGYGATGLTLLYAVGGVGEVAGNALPAVLLRRGGLWLPAAAGATVLAGNLLAVGTLWHEAWGLVLFMVVASGGGGLLLTLVGIALVSSSAATRGGAMALSAAGYELGGVLGVGGAGVALTVAGDHATVYRLLGAAVLAGLLVAAGFRARSAAPSLVGPRSGERVRDGAAPPAG